MKPEQQHSGPKAWVWGLPDDGITIPPPPARPLPEAEAPEDIRMPLYLHWVLAFSAGVLFTAAVLNWH